MERPSSVNSSADADITSQQAMQPCEIAAATTAQHIESVPALLPLGSLRKLCNATPHVTLQHECFIHSSTYPLTTGGRSSRVANRQDFSSPVASGMPGGRLAAAGKLAVQDSTHA